MEQVTMTADERAEFEAFKVEKAKQAAAEQRKQSRETYKSLISETIDLMFPVLETVSKELAGKKSDVYEAFSQALSMKRELYGVKPDQRSDTFTNKDGTRRIILGRCIFDDYDDTVNEGVAKVKEYISSLTKDKESGMLVAAIIQLLSRDQQGNLKASRVMQLRKTADESGNEQFIDGVRIIEAAHRPSPSKFYVRAEKKNELGAWVTVPLGMTEA